MSKTNAKFFSFFFSLATLLRFRQGLGKCSVEPRRKPTRRLLVYRVTDYSSLAGDDKFVILPQFCAKAASERLRRPSPGFASAW